MSEHLDNRIKQLRRDTDSIKNIKIDLEDIDRAIFYHIKNVIQPSFVENNIIKPVPVYYATPERWKSVQKDGWFRDPKSGQLIVPAIVFKSNGIKKNLSIPVDKLDGSLRKIIYKKWDKSNRYDVFSAYNNIRPSTEYYSVIIPDYIIIDYEVSIWTSYITHMNKIINKFIYSEGSYWGNNNNKFRVQYDDISNSIEMGDNENRSIRNVFNMSVFTYILPEEFNNEITTIKKLSPSKITLNIETEVAVEKIGKRNSHDNIRPNYIEPEILKKAILTKPVVKVPDDLFNFGYNVLMSWAPLITFVAQSAFEENIIPAIDSDFSIFGKSLLDNHVFTASFEVAGDLNVSSMVNNGNVTISGYSVSRELVSTSTIKLKENIETQKYQLNNILKLNPVIYYLKKDNKKYKGFIAEEVDKIYPEFIFKDNNVILGIDYTKIASVLTKAIQELYEIVSARQKNINELKTKLGDK
jgi:hypothetical protein